MATAGRFLYCFTYIFLTMDSILFFCQELKRFVADCTTNVLRFDSSVGMLSGTIAREVVSYELTLALDIVRFGPSSQKYNHWLL